MADAVVLRVNVRRWCFHRSLPRNGPNIQHELRELIRARRTDGRDCTLDEIKVNSPPIKHTEMVSRVVYRNRRAVGDCTFVFGEGGL